MRPIPMVFNLFFKMGFKNGSGLKSDKKHRFDASCVVFVKQAELQTFVSKNPKLVFLKHF